MTILSRLLGRTDESEEMSRAATVQVSPAVEELTQQLRANVADAASFSDVVERIQSDDSLSASDVIAIAHSFVGGRRAKSRKAAFTSIEQERLRLSHARAKSASASKAPVW